MGVPAVVEPKLVAERPQAQPDPMAIDLAALAANPDVSVDKLERLVAMHERMMATRARAAFDAAFSQMQAKLPTIDEKGKITVDGSVRSRYARYEDIIEAVRPVLAEFGFSLRHRNEVIDGRQMKIIGILSHRDGHSEQDEFICPPDNSGKKSPIQEMGSSRAYGQRYTTIALLNIVTKGQDNDGQHDEPREAPEAPDGYDNWVKDLDLVAEQGIKPLEAAWSKSKREYREYLSKHAPSAYLNLRKKAQAVR